MSEKKFLLIGSALGFLGVALGAFGAHGLQAKVHPSILAIFETAARYQLFHAIVIVVISFIPVRSQKEDTAGWFFTAGVIIFSGSLYLLVLTGQKFFGAVTPIGGLLLLAGWASLFLSGISKK